MTDRAGQSGQQPGHRRGGAGREQGGRLPVAIPLPDLVDQFVTGAGVPSQQPQDQVTQHGRGIGQQFPARRPALAKRVFHGFRPYRRIRVPHSLDHHRAQAEGSRRGHRQKALVRPTGREFGDPRLRFRLRTQ